MQNAITSIAGNLLHIAGHSRSFRWRKLIALGDAQFATGEVFFLRFLLCLRNNEVVQSVGGDSYEFVNAKRHGIAEKPKRDRHSIVSGG